MRASRRRALAALAATAWSPAALRAQTPIQRDTFTTTDGARLSLLRTRGTHTPTLLFLPGWGMPASIWLPQLNALGAQHAGIALDPRGQGESEAPARGYTIERRVADLAEVIERVGPVLLVGWSLGVLEALHYVHLHGATQLQGLMLVDNSVGEPPPPKPGDFLQRLRKDREKTVDAFVRGMFATPRPEAEIELIKRSALRLPVEDSIALLSYPLPREHWRTIARAFPKPLAYVVTPRLEAQAQSLKANRPATRIEVFRDAKHALFVDEPERFNRVLSEFIEDVRKS